MLILAISYSSTDAFLELMFKQHIKKNDNVRNPWHQIVINYKSEVNNVN